jgi:hypothetical protein
VIFPVKPAPFLLLGFCLLAPGLLAYAPHPSMLLVKYKDQMLPVIKVHGDAPVVMVEGKEKRLWTDPVFFVQRAEAFSDNYIDTLGVGLGGKMLLTYDGIPEPAGVTLPSATEFKANLAAKETLKGGFTVVVVYSPNNPFGDLSPDNRPKLIVHELPDLPAGQTVQVKFTDGDTGRMKNARYFIQFFDATGREVMTPGVEYAWQYYALRDLHKLSIAMGKYLERFKEADHDAVPAIMPKPVFKPGAVLPKGAVTVVLTVEANGTVSAVDAGNIADASARDSLTAALGGWLFLPKLEAGQPVGTSIQVPLKF